uniref:Uncharacterized protein n=1 Tax=viral metagenome TaxID=1070528 RepID=A0A6C0DI88_9ZZZZ
MAAQLDAKFFRKAKKVNRAVEITDNQAFIPAVRDSPEIRVNLPNRRLKTFEERKAEIEERNTEISTLEDEIEKERKTLLDLIKNYHKGGPVSEVVSQNLKVKGLMEKRSSLARPDKWIEELEGLSFKDVFASKRDDRKIKVPVYQIKRRVEPITSLYLDLGAAAEAAEPVLEAPPLPAVKPATPTPKTAAEVAQGAIIGQKKTILKLKKTAGQS